MMSNEIDLTSVGLPPNPIRVETALSRYPVHRLAKRGDVSIDIRERNENGEVSIKWEVTHNNKYGQPGPLAYKLDTLIINRRIEEARRPIPKVLRLGSFRQIISETGLKNHDTEKVRNALRQNAFAAITAKINYRKNDGGERMLQADFTRYSIVFVGEKLPDGRKADAVYIILNDIFMQVINGAMTRPLDYDYLKSLPPAPQRFYELLSYQMYSAIKNDRPRAKLLYSELCTYAPLVRQSDWDIVRPQLARIHAPHKKSGYIARIDFQDTVDNDGQPDWIMLYQPGPRARAEFRAFAKRGGPTVLEVEPFTEDPLPQLSSQATPLEAELIERGVTATIAADLARDHTEDKIRRQLEHLDWLKEKKPEKIADPAAWLVSAIRTSHAAPKGFVPRAERQRHEEARQLREHQAEEQRRQKRAEEQRQLKERRGIDAHITQLSPEARAEAEAAALAAAPAEHRENYANPVMRKFRESLMLGMLREYVGKKLNEQASAKA